MENKIADRLEQEMMNHIKRAIAECCQGYIGEIKTVSTEELNRMASGHIPRIKKLSINLTQETTMTKKDKARSAASDLSHASAYAKEAERKLSNIGDKEGAKQAKEVSDKANAAKKRVRELADPGQKG